MRTEEEQKWLDDIKKSYEKMTPIQRLQALVDDDRGKEIFVELNMLRKKGNDIWGD